ncbi:hypothetical protein WH52_07290 [Tenacibaculum holothuriorum]|uniref:Uncharacterized protein n=1 Tax=Tenacibaculum holothuriorum TaxID=1635173 RepID=A0A1Y2PDI5_9FLAO|nr:hypothetical protein [Tenacibaculum holothuriorum]OSY88543.1 hypothetical protein WH52_07290 [Tenacibaculum holothuriorum]
MKNAITIVLVFFLISSMFSQEKEELVIFKNSKNWKREIIKFPIDWAPKLTITGFEELLFSPKWKDNKSDDFWSLLIGWKVNTAFALSLRDIEHNLHSYFDGLMKPNHWAQKFPQPIIHLRKNTFGFYGTMTFFDGFHTGKVITVNILGEQKFDKRFHKSIITFRLSPKSFHHRIWKNLTSIKLKKDKFNLIDLDSTWGKEALRFPARNMNYRGTGEVRFPPKGWIKPKHDNFWSYTYAWSINIDREIPEKELEIDLVKYFNSLNRINMNDVENKHYSSATVTKTKQNKSTIFYKGKVNIYDRFATKKMIALNILIESYYCKEKQKTVILFKFSPKDFNHKTWGMLGKIKLHTDSCE